MTEYVSRRALVCAMLALAAPPIFARRAFAATAVTVHKDPSCGCCQAWVAHIRRAGFAATVVDEPDMAALKARLKIPAAFASCHTAEIDGYVVEGHVPADAILRLLRERPAAVGLAAPGMPDGSPGMETGGPPETFEVLLFGPEAPRSYGRYRGEDRV